MVESNQKIANFVKSCDELANCKFLIAEHKITKLLSDLASSSEICDLVADCLEQFNRDKEFAKTFIQDGHGEYQCIMPTEEFKIIALVFCLLVDIDSKTIDFTDFIKRFFGNNENSYRNFVETMIIPFRDLIVEAFGFYEQEENEEPIDLLEEEDLNAKILTFPIYRNRKGDKDDLPEICDKAQKIATQILVEVENSKRNEEYYEELKAICYAIIMACYDQDFDILRGLSVGLKYAGRNFKPIKFLVKELEQEVNTFFDNSGLN